MERALVRERYDRIAPLYDLVEAPVEWLFFGAWRRELWAPLTDGTILEVGIGTGKNLPFHPEGARITGIDFSPGMLARARARAEHLGRNVELIVADAERLPFEANEFDAAVASFVFCSIPDPARALAELARVVRPGGRVVLLEHVLSRRPWLASAMRGLAPVPRVVWGTSIDRDTVSAVECSPLRLCRNDALWLDLVRLVEARVD